MNARLATCLLAAAGLSACDLGQGSKPVSLTIIPAGIVNAAGQLQMTECFREPLALQVTFSDGQIGNVTSRATWSSSDETKVRVSNGDVNIQTIVDGVFTTQSAVNFSRGTLIPMSDTPTPVTVTANFLGLTASMPVVVDSLASVTPVLVPRPISSGAPVATKFIGEGFSERFTIRLTKNGRLLDAGDFGRNDSIFNSFFNPVRWTFAGGVFSDGNTTDTDTTNDADLVLVGDTTTRATATATLTPNGGLVTGVNADTAQRTVTAELSAVDGVSARCGSAITANAQIADVISPLMLSHEKDFNSFGATPSSATASDLVINTNELLKVTANLVGPTTPTQDVTAQVDYEVIEADRDVCVEFEDSSTTPTTTQTRCNSSVLTLGFGGFLTTVAGTDGSFNVLVVDNRATPLVNEVTNPPFIDDTTIDEVRVRACFPLCADDSNDVLAAGTIFSDPLKIRAIPATLDSVAIAPSTSAPIGDRSQSAFTVPGLQFKAYGTYTATSPGSFAGGANTATQNIGRFLSWVARPSAVAPLVSDEFSDVAQLTNGNSSGNTEATGQVFYICNPAFDSNPALAIEVVDIFAVTANTTVVSATISDAIARATLTVQHNPAVLDRTCE